MNKNTLSENNKFKIIDYRSHEVTKINKMFV